MTMPTVQTELTRRVDEVRVLSVAENADPREVFDQTQALIASFEAQQLHVPNELREIAADLEAEIVEDFYDNLPV